MAGYQAREERWNRLYATGLDRDDPREDAVEEVLGLLTDDDVTSIGYRHGGATSISQPQVLADQLGIQIEQLTGHRDSFVGDGVMIAP
ncbi:hypothetical protein [Corynebacterium meridianum]|uniref:Uncharacterized protein n=1 Tax=Corynebacterium meridianum TaxID=2765363 RepID=A0A934I4Z8_9CORY|nr:hypothetical protein [Corynebacterium meridianum]MBI8989176.1 hypothetical protein [Corynebacterium meridianum]